MEELSRILHQPIRTRIMALLLISGPHAYSEIKKELELSDGHMTTHMKELLKARFVSAKKEFVDNKPRTTYSITPDGRRAFKEYIKALKKIIMLE